MGGPDDLKVPIIDESQYLELDKVDKVTVFTFLKDLGISQQNLYFINALQNEGWKVVAWLDHRDVSANQKAVAINRKYPRTTLRLQIDYGVDGNDGAENFRGTVYLYR
ncbi:MAG: hypothetical protein WC843_01960 [Candidatus Gracilibacteria bacterium]|jgi:hypothetical protein